MSLEIKINESDIKSELVSKYKSFSHIEKIPVNKGNGVYELDVKSVPNTVTSDIEAIINSVAHSVYLNLKKDLDSIKQEIDKIETIFNTHVHPATGGPTGPSTTQI